VEHGIEVDRWFHAFDLSIIEAASLLASLS
jgi:hypothetical protein